VTAPDGSIVLINGRARALSARHPQPTRLDQFEAEVFAAAPGAAPDPEPPLSRSQRTGEVVAPSEMVLGQAAGDTRICLSTPRRSATRRADRWARWACSRTSPS